MTTLDVESELEVRATSVHVTDSELAVEFEDGRTLKVPLAWYPRLIHGTSRERKNFKIGAFGIHWPDLDEDVGYRGLLLGRKSGESNASLKFWLDARRKGKKTTLEDFSSGRKTKKRKK
jgi:hypothetical protein